VRCGRNLAHSHRRHLSLEPSEVRVKGDDFFPAWSGDLPSTFECFEPDLCGGWQAHWHELY